MIPEPSGAGNSSYLVSKKVSMTFLELIYINVFLRCH